MRKIADLIHQVVEEIKPWGDMEYDEFISKVKSSDVIKVVRAEVEELTSRFPLPN